MFERNWQSHAAESAKVGSIGVEPGSVLADKYRIVRVLGEGGMGVVVEALDMGLERRVAIKFLLPSFAQSPEATARFTREARAAVKIQSEHVARVIDVGKLDDGSPYMVMEFLEGSDMSQAIEASGALPVEDAALYVIQACEALAEAHAHGIVHRDLKPANLFLAEQAGGSRKVKVLDFGISKTLVDDKALGSLTRTSTSMGSPLYMSPEQMKSTRDVDLRTDIWALGVILHEALAGQTPFTGGSIPEISAQILLEDPVPLSELNPAIPRELSDVAQKAMRKQPDLRFQNVGDLAMALLPFAPNRARANVERIIRVLKAAGMAEGEFLASLAPDGAQGGAVEVLQIENVGATGLGLLNHARPAEGTLANWGQTHTEGVKATRRSQRRLMLAGAASLFAVGASLAYVLAADAPAGPLEADADAASRAAAAAPVAAAPPESAANEVVEAEPEPPATEAAGETPEATEAPVAAEATASDGASPAPAPQAKPAAVREAPTKRRPRRTVRGVTKPTPKSDSVDFKSKFGSRK